MKLLQWLPLSLAALAASGQSIIIAAPTNGSSINAGSSFTVEIDQPDNISSAVNIGIAIGFGSCIPNTVYSGCFSAQEGLGRILLYSGSFNPEFGSGPDQFKPPFQNFTVTIPGDVPLGQAQLSVANFLTIGAGYDPIIDPLFITLNIV